MEIQSEQSLEASDVSRFVRNIVRRPEFVIFSIIIILTAAVSIKQPNFISSINIVSIVNYISFTGMIAVPLVLLLVAKMLDMSIGAVTGFLSAVLAVLTKYLGITPIFAVCLILMFGIIIGFINGFLIVKLNINAFILTLAMMYFYRGLMQVIQNGQSITKLPQSLLSVANISILGLTLNIYMFVLVAIIGWFVLQKTSFGKNLYIIGNNDVIAKISGINSNRSIWLLYVAMGLVCAICAYFITLQYRVADVTTGNGWEFSVTSGCMLGGCSMYGGKGTVLGGVLGIMLMSVITYALQAFNVVSGYQVAVTGAVLITAVSIDIIRARKISI